MFRPQCWIQRGSFPWQSSSPCSSVVIRASSKPDLLHIIAEQTGSPRLSNIDGLPNYITINMVYGDVTAVRLRLYCTESPLSVPWDMEAFKWPLSCCYYSFAMLQPLSIDAHMRVSCLSSMVELKLPSLAFLIRTLMHHYSKFAKLPFTLTLQGRPP